jgi:hypothetical protein
MKMSCMGDQKGVSVEERMRWRRGRTGARMIARKPMRRYRNRMMWLPTITAWTA